MKTKTLVQWLEIKPNERINKLIDKLPEIYTNQSNEYGKDIHTTHITAECLRQSYFRITRPTKTTSREAKAFIVGEAQHVIMQRLLGPLLNAQSEKRLMTNIKNGRYVGIVSRVDMLAGDSEHIPNGAVVELKTNSAFNRQIKDYYLKQIKFYMAATGKLNAVLIIIWQNSAKEVIDNKLHDATRMIEAYDITITADELKQETKNFEKRYFELTNALIAQDASTLFAVKQDVNLRKIVCKWCPHKKICDEIDPKSKRVFVFKPRRKTNV